MGNIFSNEEKLLRHQRNEVILGKNPRQIYGIYDQYGNNQVNHLYIRQNEHRYKKKRNVSFHGRYGRNEYLKTKSHSLSAILEELYTFEPEDYAEEEIKTRFETSGSLIPRIKLKRTTSSLKEEKNYKTLCKMSSESEIVIREDSTKASINGFVKKENNNITRSENNITILLSDQTYDEISSKSDENYFAKNFDDCMKRLQQIEKEHELIENEEKDVEFCDQEKESIQANISECEFQNYDNDSTEVKETNLETQSQSCGKGKNSTPVETVATQLEENYAYTAENTQPVFTSWYSNLKQQFEKTEPENEEPKTKEMTCRITGATLKNNQNEKIKLEEKEKDRRHYFSRLVKTNKSLIDEELPDPDKVKHIRAMFQETLNSTLKRKLDKKLGGSLQNISYRSAEQQMSRPLSAQCYRNDLFSQDKSNQKSDEEKDKLKENSKSLKDGNGEFQIENAKRKLFEKYERDLKPGKDSRSKRVLQPKWTDSGSVSSGISSDLSSYDTDIESYSREGTEQDEMTVSDDDLLEEVKDKHYVQNEILEKIRSFGTSVTYYGGEMITCSVGPILSPTTQAIMEEIGEKFGPETSPIRSFDEFYRKYIETNEYNRKKKLGRTRSFGQNDVFQKPNVLNNTEIDLYKNDLEIEIGIKKPLGNSQNSLKRKLTKSASLETKPETIDKTKEKCPEVIISTCEPNILSDSMDENETSEKDLVTECEAINKDLTEETSIVSNSKVEKKFDEETENHIDILEIKDAENKGETAKEEPTKLSTEKDRFYMRSQSAPEGFSANKNTSNQCENISNNIEHPSKEIFFSYEKSIFNKKINSDMEFEEFEVCESVTEKLDKLEKKNSFEKPTTNQELFNDKEVENEKKELTLNTSGAEKADPNETQDVQLIGQEDGVEGKKEENQKEKKESKHNYTKWPIETSVMVDIQKSTEQTPKIISSGKTVAKTKESKKISESTMRLLREQEQFIKTFKLFLWKIISRIWFISFVIIIPKQNQPPVYSIWIKNRGIQQSL